MRVLRINTFRKINTTLLSNTIEHLLSNIFSVFFTFFIARHRHGYANKIIITSRVFRQARICVCSIVNQLVM